MGKTLTPSNPTFLSDNPIKKYRKHFDKRKEEIFSNILSHNFRNSEFSAFQPFLESLPMIIIIKDKNLNYITGSKNSERFLNTGIDPFNENIHLNMEDAKASIELEDNYVLETGKSIIKKKGFIDINGKMHYYKIQKCPVINNNNLSGIITVAQNIDEEIEQENQKEIYLATLTHDLKNPLIAQISSLQLLSEGAFGEINSEQKEFIEMIIESEKFMQEMLYSILNTYKYDNGIIELCKKDFDLNDLIIKCVKESESLAKDKNIEIILKPKLTTDIFADATQIRRVITNLLNNSISYGFRNSKIEISTSKNFNNIQFCIKNSSPEIPEEIKDQIFDKYVTGTKLNKKFGIGLGLYLCKRVIETHGGKIYVKGNGTNNQFIFELPAVKQESTSLLSWD